VVEEVWVPNKESSGWGFLVGNHSRAGGVRVVYRRETTVDRTVRRSNSGGSTVKGGKKTISASRGSKVSKINIDVVAGGTKRLQGARELKGGGSGSREIGLCKCRLGWVRQAR